MTIFELDEMINGLGIDPTSEQLDKLYEVFERDFVRDILLINGLKVRVIMSLSKVEGYEAYPETFVHLITRKGVNGKRVFDKHRANKIHWVRCILENRKEDEITYFQYPEDDGGLRDYYWFVDGDFLVIMEKVAPDYIVISSFHIDNDRYKKNIEKKCAWYRANSK